MNRLGPREWIRRALACLVPAWLLLSGFGTGALFLDALFNWRWPSTLEEAATAPLMGMLYGTVGTAMLATALLLWFAVATALGRICLAILLVLAVVAGIDLRQREQGLRDYRPDLELNIIERGPYR